MNVLVIDYDASVMRRLAPILVLKKYAGCVKYCSEAKNALQLLKCWTPKIVFVRTELWNEMYTVIFSGDTRDAPVFVLMYNNKQHWSKEPGEGAILMIRTPIYAKDVDRLFLRVKRIKVVPDQCYAFLILKFLRAFIIIRYKDIIEVRAKLNYCSITTKAASFLICITLSRLLKYLPAGQFWRMNRSSVFQVEYLLTLQEWPSHMSKLSPASRKGAKEYQEKLCGHSNTQEKAGKEQKKADKMGYSTKIAEKRRNIQALVSDQD